MPIYLYRHVHALSSRAGELYENKEVYDSLGALLAGFKDPKRPKMTKILTCFFLACSYFVRLKVDELVHHTCTIFME